MSSRLTVVENIYHQNPGENPFQISNSYEYQLEDGGEEPYQHSYKVGIKPTVLDCGWIIKCGLVHIKNNSKTTVIIAYRLTLAGYGFEIPAGCSTRFYPTNPKGIQLSVRDSDIDEARVTVTVFPK